MTTNHTPPDRAADDAAHELTPAFDLRELLQLHPRLLLAALLVSLLMLPVGLFLAALGVWVLKISGGAAHDTSVLVATAGFIVADFWGGGMVAGLTGVRARQVAMAWALAHGAVLILIALLVTGASWAMPVEAVLAIPAAWAGARVARKQAQLRRQSRIEQQAAAAAPVVRDD